MSALAPLTQPVSPPAPVASAPVATAKGNDVAPTEPKKKKFSLFGSKKSKNKGGGKVKVKQMEVDDVQELMGEG